MERRRNSSRCSLSSRCITRREIRWAGLFREREREREREWGEGKRERGGNTALRDAAPVHHGVHIQTDQRVSFAAQTPSSVHIDQRADTPQTEHRSRYVNPSLFPGCICAGVLCACERLHLPRVALRIPGLISAQDPHFICSFFCSPVRVGGGSAVA